MRAAVFVLVLAAGTARAQVAPPPPTATAEPRSTDELGSILAHLAVLDRQIDVQRKALAEAANDEEKERAAGDLARTRAERAGLEASFARFATGVDLAALEDQPEEKPDWQQELFALVQPLLREVKSATAGARQMDKLRIEILKLEGRLPVIEHALASTAATRAEVQGVTEVAKEIDELAGRLRQRRGIVVSQLSVARHELAELDRARKPFTETAREAAANFFATRGRNLTIALVAMVGVFVGLRLLHRVVVRLSPTHRGEVRGFAARLVDVTAYLAAALGSFGALVAVLYTSGDWLLLSIASILILGLVITARTAVPRMANTILFLLNLGTVREGERLVYEGLPWRVASLRFSAVLENPDLEGGRLVLPIRELLGRYSRRAVAGEPWFPTRKGDHVELKGGGLGWVTCQTVEVVVIETGGGQTTIPTIAFMASGVRNLSAGFAVTRSFSLGAALEGSSTDVPAALAADLRAALEKEPWGRHLREVVIELEEPGATSLEYSALASFDGAAASSFPAIRRALARALLMAIVARGYAGASDPQAILHETKRVRGRPEPAAAGGGEGRE